MFQDTVTHFGNLSFIIVDCINVVLFVDVTYCSRHLRSNFISSKIEIFHGAMNLQSMFYDASHIYFCIISGGHKIQYVSLSIVIIYGSADPHL